MTHTYRTGAGSAHAPRRAFTLIEVLVVVAIIALLIGIGGAVYSVALGRGERAATEQFMRSITVAIEQFRVDHGFLPPLLAPDSILSGQGNNGVAPLSDLNSFEFVVPNSQSDAVEALRNTRYMSLISLPVYLVGVGDLAPFEPAATDPDRHDGVAGPGLRAPGPDRAWGGARERTTDTHRAPRTGRTYGPYLDVASGRNFSRTRDFRLTNLGGEGDPPVSDAPFGEREYFVLQDRWGSPIRYYRDWPVRNATGAREPSLDRVPVELLRPVTFQEGFVASGQPRLEPETDADILRAPYALLSAGSDGVFAETGDDNDNNGFARGSMPEALSNASVYENFYTNAPRRNAFLASLENNIRVLP